MIENTPENRRFFDDPGGIVSPCGFCVHNRPLKNGVLVCDAFPEGIPRELQFEVLHTAPFSGDHGIQFELNPRMAKSFYFLKAHGSFGKLREL